MSGSMNTLNEPKGWHGVWTALVTPLQKSSMGLELDVPSLKKLMDSQIENGVHGFVIAGSTGEGSLLSEKNYEHLLREAHQIAKGRVPLVAGLGIGGTDTCLAKAKLAKTIGYQGVLASPPAYIKATQEGLIAHFLKIAECEIPVCLYEVPSRAASSIQVATIEKILTSNNPSKKWIVAIKDATGDLRRLCDEVLASKNKLALLSGDDGTFAPFALSGGHGCISVASHFLPKGLNKILNFAKQGQTQSATEVQNHINAFVDALFWESNPIPVKSLLAANHRINTDNFYEPLRPMTPEKLQSLIQLHTEAAKRTSDA